MPDPVTGTRVRKRGENEGEEREKERERIGSKSALLFHSSFQ